ncbi:hypothetical protein RGQ29_016722 [Quercus rubra]|uniref:Secreted protein n=1 Tax=Quercus rubra TaxID=3512 RepID=A0AAN7IZU2_QUERU|nr:hypothetical protein RGQ29_016722 [Quercus rubra]
MLFFLSASLLFLPSIPDWSIHCFQQSTCLLQYSREQIMRYGQSIDDGETTSSMEARLCLNLRGRRRSRSPTTTFMDPAKSLNLAAGHSLISDL